MDLSGLPRAPRRHLPKHKKVELENRSERESSLLPFPFRRVWRNRRVDSPGTEAKRVSACSSHLDFCSLSRSVVSFLYVFFPGPPIAPQPVTDLESEQNYRKVKQEIPPAPADTPKKKRGPPRPPLRQ